VTTCYNYIEDEITVTSSAISVVYYYHPFTWFVACFWFSCFRSSTSQMLYFMYTSCSL